MEKKTGLLCLSDFETFWKNLERYLSFFFSDLSHALGSKFIVFISEGSYWKPGLNSVIEKQHCCLILSGLLQHHHLLSLLFLELEKHIFSSPRFKCEPASQLCEESSSSRYLLIHSPSSFTGSRAQTSIFFENWICRENHFLFYCSSEEINLSYCYRLKLLLLLPRLLFFLHEMTD